MEREIIFESDNAIVYYDDADKLIVWKPLKKVGFEEVKDSFNIALDKIKESHKKGVSVNWLNLAENLKVMSKETLTWISNVITRDAYDNGLRKVAFTKPKDVFGYSAIVLYVKFTKLSSTKVLIENFKNEEQALEWLQH